VLLIRGGTVQKVSGLPACELVDFLVS